MVVNPSRAARSVVVLTLCRLTPDQVKGSFVLLCPNALRYSFAKQLAESHSGLVQLRLRSTSGAPQDFSNLTVLITFDVVENEYRAITRRKLRQRLVECNPIYD